MIFPQGDFSANLPALDADRNERDGAQGDGERDRRRVQPLPQGQWMDATASAKSRWPGQSANPPNPTRRRAGRCCRANPAGARQLHKSNSRNLNGGWWLDHHFSHREHVTDGFRGQRGGGRGRNLVLGLTLPRALDDAAKATRLLAAKRVLGRLQQSVILRIVHQHRRPRIYLQHRIGTAHQMQAAQDDEQDLRKLLQTGVGNWPNGTDRRKS